MHKASDDGVALSWHWFAAFFIAIVALILATDYDECGRARPEVNKPGTITATDAKAPTWAQGFYKDPDECNASE